jgi:peptidoglycan-N-acetylglucosamine deacetylase
LEENVKKTNSPKASLYYGTVNKLGRNKYWLLVIPIILVAGLALYLSKMRLVQASISRTKTFPKASVLDVNVGNLDTEGLASKLAGLKSEFDNKKITLANGKSQWVFNPGKLGITFDSQATSQAIWKLNDLSLVDKYKLQTGETSPAIDPVISIDTKQCTESTSVIPVVQTKPVNATVYYDSGLKIQPESTGLGFDSALTCQELLGQLTKNISTMNIHLNTIAVDITKTNLEAILPDIQSIVGKSLTLKSGSYELVLNPKDLLGLLDITKKESKMQIDWSSARLDSLVQDIAAKVETKDKAPSMRADQYLISYGGYRLDKGATKKIFEGLSANSSRSYNLSVAHVAPVIGTRKVAALTTPIVNGNGSAIYLTFDDGLTYGNQIMNYAAQYGAKITFFELGSRVGTDAAALRRAIAEGHAVQSHGYEHAMYDYGQRSYDWQYNDIKQSIGAIMNVTGVRPTYFRPPGGNRSASTYTAASANGLKLILWGASSKDTAGIGSAVICANVLAGAYPGASILMHSVKITTTNAVPCIMQGLAARGYSMQALR